MILAKSLSLSLTLFLLVIADLKAQVGEKFYGRASYYADKFHGRSTSSGEIYDRAEYTAAHRNLPFNTIVEVINTTNNRTAVVKINDRGPFAYNRMLDLSFAAAKDLELLGPGEAEIEMKILSMDKSEYTISSFYAGTKGEFTREFNQYEPVSISGKNIVKVRLDTTYLSHNSTAKSLQPKPITKSFVIADSLRKQQEEGDKMGFRQHKYIRVIKDGDGHYRLDSSIVTPPTAQEVYSVAPQNKNFNLYESRPQTEKNQVQKQGVVTKINETRMAMETIKETVQVDNRVDGFRQYQYVKMYTDNEGRIRVDTSQKSSVQFVKNVEKQADSRDDKLKIFNNDLTNLSKVGSSKLGKINPKENYKNGFKQYSYIKIYKDKDGKLKVDTTNFERPK